MRSRALVGVLATLALAYSLTQTMVIPALPAIGERYGAGPATTAWLLTGFLLSASICAPLAGRLGDLLGRGRVLLGVIVLFGAGLVLSAVADSIWVMLAGRIVQGAGAAMIPLAAAIARDELRPDRVAPAIGLLAAMIGAGSGIGLILAGVILDNVGIAWIFWSTAVLTAVATLGAWHVVPRGQAATGGSIDWVGAALLSGGLVALMLTVSQGGALGWMSMSTLGLVATTCLLLVLTVRFELGHPSPLLDLPLLARRAVWTTNAATLALGFAMFGLFTLLPQLIQLTSGPGFARTATVAGFVMLPSSVLLFLAGPLGGRLDRTHGSRSTFAGGAALTAAASALLAARHGTLIDLAVGAGVMGAGIGLGLAAMTNLSVQAVDATQTGAAAGINSVMRTLGGALGAQVIAVVLAASTLAGTGTPSDFAFELGFAISAVAGGLALGAVALIPRRSSPRDSAMPR